MNRVDLAGGASQSETSPGTTSSGMRGLSSAAAKQRLVEFGPNEIRRERGVSSLTLFVRQFASPVIWLLLGAATVSVLLRELVDAITIGAIVVINAVIGFLQEHRAERAVTALRSMTAPRARVVRDGHSLVVPAQTIVPGDLLVLEAGEAARRSFAHCQ
jgi:Ca2+-transporting ATPase